MVFYNTLPLYGALLGALFLDEAIGFPHIIGGLLIVSGGIWAARKQPAVRSHKLVAGKTSNLNGENNNND
jgi:drug/metabolite transporter (DMT)-like permease